MTWVMVYPGAGVTSGTGILSAGGTRLSPSKTLEEGADGMEGSPLSAQAGRAVRRAASSARKARFPFFIFLSPSPFFPTLYAAGRGFVKEKEKAAFRRPVPCGN